VFAPVRRRTDSRHVRIAADQRQTATGKLIQDNDGGDRIARLRSRSFKLLNFFFYRPHIYLQDGNNGEDLGITEELQELIEKRDVSVELGGATVTLSPRNLEENELGLTLRLPSSAEPRSEYNCSRI